MKKKKRFIWAEKSVFYYTKGVHFGQKSQCFIMRNGSFWAEKSVLPQKVVIFKLESKDGYHFFKWVRGPETISSVGKIFLAEIYFKFLRLVVLKYTPPPKLTWDKSVNFKIKLIRRHNTKSYSEYLNLIYIVLRVTIIKSINLFDLIDPLCHYF